LSARKHAVFLDSGGEGPSARYSILAADPRELIRVEQGRILHRLADGSTVVRSGDPLDLLAERIAQLEPSESAASLPFRAGAIGYLGYGVRHLVEGSLPVAQRPDALPELWFGLYDRALVYDHSQGAWQAPGAWSQLELAELLQGPAPPPPPEVPRSTIQSEIEPAAYRAAISRILQQIAAGDVYQVNMTQRFSGRAPLPPVALYRRLRRLNPAPFSAYLDLGRGRAVLSSSPERFLELRGRRIRTRPIKGTRPRGGDAAADQRLARELLESEKDAAELAMIVDLMRNDLGRVACFGSVKVTEARRLERYANVHHLVATVEATLRDGLDWRDLLRATFPGGSVTGAPKIRAMQIIAELEPRERGVYTGSIGYIDLDGAIDLSVVIRTMLVDGARAWFQAGGGIVADSDPAAEYRESLDKARPLAHVLGAEL